MIIRGIRRFAAVCAAWGMAALLLAMLPVISRADLSFTVTLNTSGLIGHPAGNAPPGFQLDFQLVDGSGPPAGNNTVLVSGFNFGVGGAAVGSPTLTGNATGTLGAGLSLHDSSFLNEFTQSFTPGSTLSFNVHTTTNAELPTPDEFTFAIFDKSGVEIPTTDPTGFNTFVTVTLDSANPAVNAYASDSTVAPAAGGPPITTGPAIISNVVRSAAVPLPSGWLGAVVCLALLPLFQLGKRMHPVRSA